MNPARAFVAVLTGVTGVIAAPLVVPAFMPWSEINCQHQEEWQTSGNYFKAGEYLRQLRDKDRTED